MMMNKLYLKISNPIFPFICHVFLGYTNTSEIKPHVKGKTKSNTKLLHDKIDELDLSGVKGRTVEHYGHIILVVKEFNKSVEFYDTLHHELVHAVDFSADYIGMEQPTTIREFSAYLTGFYVNQIYQKIL